MDPYTMSISREVEVSDQVISLQHPKRIVYGDK